MELFLSCFAVLISVTSLAWTVVSSRSQRESNAILSNNLNIISIESQIAKIPQLLRFHGIENPEEELKRYDVSAEELTYLLNSFTIAGAYYRTSPKATRSLQKGSYRYNMCLSPATRRAWPLVRYMLNNDHYRERLDSIFRELDQHYPLDSVMLETVSGKEETEN